MASKKLEIRRAAHEDCEDILKWRNDNHSRAMSINSHKVSEQEHLSWFNEIMGNSRNEVFIGCYAGEKLGVVSFRQELNSIYVSINMNPSFRGKKLSAYFLQKVIENYCSFRKGIIKFIAKIKEENTASKKIFIKCGFHFISSENGVETYRFRNFL